MELRRLLSSIEQENVNIGLDLVRTFGVRGLVMSLEDDFKGMVHGVPLGVAATAESRDFDEDETRHIAAAGLVAVLVVIQSARETDELKSLSLSEVKSAAAALNNKLDNENDYHTSFMLNYPVVAEYLPSLILNYYDFEELVDRPMRGLIHDGAYSAMQIITECADQRAKQKV